MPTFPFIIQSSDTLDHQSMKYVRSHVTRQSMQKRRLMTDRDNQKPPHATPPKASRRQQRQAQVPKTTRQPSISSEDSNEQQDETLCELSTRRQADVERLGPTGQMTGTSAEFSTIMDIPKEKLLRLLSNYQEFTSLYHVQEQGQAPAFAPFSGYLNVVAYHNPLWLTSTALVAFSKLDTMRDKTTVDILQYKVLALQHLRKALKQPESTRDDITVMALIAFMTFEILTAESPEDHFAVAEHFKGIETLVRLRGGAKEVSKTPIGRLMCDGLHMYHLMYAVMYNKQVSAHVDGPPKPEPESISFVDEPHLCFSPLTKSPFDDNMLCVADNNTLSVIPFLSNLSAAWELLYLEYHSDPNSFENMTYSACRKQLQLPQEPVVAPTGDTQNDIQASKNARACYIAGRIFFRAITSLTPFADPANDADVAELHTVMRTMDKSSWTMMPYVHLWIAMVGVSACTTARQKTYFGTQMSRAAILFGGRWLNSFSQHAHNFLWLQRVLRGEVVPMALETSDTEYPVEEFQALDIETIQAMQPPWPQDKQGTLLTLNQRRTEVLM